MEPNQAERNPSRPDLVQDNRDNGAHGGPAHLVDVLAGAGQRDFTRLDLSDLAQITRTPLEHIRSQFASTDAWVDAYYCHLTDRYRAMVGAIPDFGDYTVGEKLLNFFLTSLDMMREHEPFVRSTYHHFILDRFTSTRFEQSVAKLFREFTEQDSRVAFSQQILLFSPVYTWWSREYLHLTGFRLSQPDSGEKVMALAEKTTGLLNEFLYNGVVDSTVDLGKYLIQSGFVTAWTPVTVLRKFLRF
jgi:hypothetical protein